MLHIEIMDYRSQRNKMMSSFADLQPIPTTSKAKFPSKTEHQRGRKSQGISFDLESEKDQEYENDTDENEHEGNLTFFHMNIDFCSLLTIDFKFGSVFLT